MPLAEVTSFLENPRWEEVYYYGAEAKPTTSISIRSANQGSASILLSDGFDYPVGPPHVSQENDGDGYYAAGVFGEYYSAFGQYHLGEDWNGEGGGDSDFGYPVYAVSNGTVVYAQEAPGTLWGNVVIIEHTLSNGFSVRSLYGHLRYGSLLIKNGDLVTRRQKIAEIGKGYRDSVYLAHLHFEIRTDTLIGVGTGLSNSADREDWEGWAIPSDFIDAHA